MNKPPQDFGIPMLTEVLETPPSSLEDIDAIPELTQVAEPGVASKEEAIDFEDELIADTVVPSTATIAQWQDDEWAHLQDQITERVLAQFMRRINAELETRVRDNLADVLQLAVDQLSGEIRNGLQHTLEDVISNAVKREIADFKSSGR